MQVTEASSNEAAILSRVVQPGKNGLSATVARALLKLKFAADDQRRMHELAVKNQSDELTRAERRELDDYLRVGRLLDLLAAKARLSLQKRRRDA